MTATAFRVCIAGGGPAGVVLGYLLARAGLDVVILEKHGDFLRDFRGDTIHPSTMEVMHELGLLQSFLQRPHNRMSQAQIQLNEKLYAVSDFSRLPVQCPFIAFMPQWEFLNFFADAAARYPNFSLRMNTEATDLIEEDGKVVGVTVVTETGAETIRADLVVGADGRQSKLREVSGLKVQNIGAAMDALWMRVEKTEEPGEAVFARMMPGKILITIDRGDYWQCAYVIPKGHFEELKKQGMEAFRDGIAVAAPALAPQLHALKDWSDISLLSVRIDRLERWWRPGLLFIGDAAHAMSPVGGVGINLAIQDAVAAANALVPAVQQRQQEQQGQLGGEVLSAIQARREPATRSTQKMQLMIQNRLLVKVIGGAMGVPLPLRLLNAIPYLRRFPAKAFGLGVQPEHVEIGDYFSDREQVQG